MKRVLTSLVLIPFVLYVVMLGPYWLLLVITVLVALQCFREYCEMIGPLGPFGYAAGLLLLLLHQRHTLVLITIVALLALAVNVRSDDLGKTLPRAAALVFGVVYVFGCWKFAILLRTLSPHWLAYTLVLCWIGDISAYYTGRSLGHHKMAPGISPGKSWEGATASLACSAAFGVFYLAKFVPSIAMWQALALSAAANIAGQLGDLSESALKRGAGVKDSSALLPGHGGLLDRVDSTMFALPLVHLFAERMIM